MFYSEYPALLLVLWHVHKGKGPLLVLFRILILYAYINVSYRFRICNTSFSVPTHDVQ